MQTYDLVVIGVSAGGLAVLSSLVSKLAPDYGLAIAIVQHRAKESTALCELLQDCTPLRVTEVIDKEPIVPGSIYVAPPDYHVLVERGFFSLSTDAPLRYSRPSIDILFETAADAYRNRVVGVVLTGANSDGSRGLQRIVEAGGTAVVQDPEEAEVSAMPEAAMRAVSAAHVLPLDGIATFLASLQSPEAGEREAEG